MLAYRPLSTKDQSLSSSFLESREAESSRIGAASIQSHEEGLPPDHQARDLTRNTVGQALGSLWFSSAVARNPNVSKGVVVDDTSHAFGRDGFVSESPMDTFEDRERAYLARLQQVQRAFGSDEDAPYMYVPSHSSRMPPDVGALTSPTLGDDTLIPLLASAREEQLEDIKDDGGGGGQDDEFFDNATSRLYDELLTHFLSQLSRATKELLLLYYVNSGLSVFTTSMTIVLNALIMVAKHLSIPKQVVTIFAAMNMIAKGLEMKFKFTHEVQNLQSCLEDAKLLAAEAEDLLLKAKHNNLEKSEFLEFKFYFARAFREFAYYVQARELDMLDAFIEPGASSKKLDEEEGDGPEAEMQDLFMEQLKHYTRQLVAATSSLKTAFCMSNTACTVLTMMTLCINPMIISAGEMHLDRTLVAYLAGINTIAKGFELRFKFEHQKSYAEHQLKKVHVLKTEVEQLTILGEARMVSEVEISSFKRALDDAMEGFAMYMLEGDTNILEMNRKNTPRPSVKNVELHHP